MCSRTADATAPELRLNELSDASSTSIATDQNDSNLDGNDGISGRGERARGMMSTIMCRYFVAGICRFGSLCRYSHDRNVGDQSSNPSLENEEDKFDSASALNNVPTNEQLPTNSTVVYDPTNPNSWINAPVFVPKYSTNHTQCDDETEEALQGSISNEELINSKSYAQILSGRNGVVENGATDAQNSQVSELLCPYMRGTPIIGGNNELTLLCPYGFACEYTHGCLCDTCGQFCLHPTDMQQRKQHQSDCIRQHEKDMELSFAIARSKDKTCGICFENVMEKNGREQRFGILPNCNHIFCLQCIRKWRQAKQFDNNIIRACPECRVTSDFICPSMYWVDCKEDKDKLINDYKDALGRQNCKYFKQGSGKCPFGNKCFYRHALPNGNLVDVGMPNQQERRRHNANGETDVFQQLLLWHFLDVRDNIYIDDSIVVSLSESSDSDLSESDIMFDA